MKYGYKSDKSDREVFEDFVRFKKVFVKYFGDSNDGLLQEVAVRLEYLAKMEENI